MPRLSREEMERFLAGGSHLMRLSTLTAKGWPYVNPVWYQYEDGTFLLAGRRKARWVANIRRDGRVSASIDTCEPPYTRVLVKGVAEIVDGAWLGDWEAWSIRYLGPKEGRRYYQETRHVPRALVRITPRAVTSWAGPGWHPRYEE